MRQVLPLLSIALLVAPVGAANRFTDDVNCVALWSFENGALTTDSGPVGTNTLTNNGVDSDTGNYKEGAGSGSWVAANLDRMSIQSDNMSTKFPLKSSRVDNTMSVCFWLRPASLPASGSHAFLMSYHTTGVSYNFDLTVYNNSGTMRVRHTMGYNGGLNTEVVYHDVPFVTSRWYHVAFSRAQSDKAYHLRVYGVTEAQTWNFTGNYANALETFNDALVIGRYGTDSYYYDGIMDEMVVFNDILTDEEIDAIRGGTYGSSGIADWWWRRRHGN